MKLKSDVAQARSACAAMESERKKWLSQLETENMQLKQLYDDAKRAKEQLVAVSSTRSTQLVVEFEFS